MGQMAPSGHAAGYCAKLTSSKGRLGIPCASWKPRTAYGRTTHPARSGLAPAVGFLRGPERVLGIGGLELWGGATPHASPVIAPIALLMAIGETIQHQKIQHLILPCGRGGKELPIAESRQI